MAVDRQRIYHKRDRLRQLRAFCYAARLGTITQAAESLGITQPAVSLHVRELENELQAILLDRGGSGVTLTAAGKRLYELAEPLAHGMDDLSVNFMERIDDTVVGRLQFAASVAGVVFVLPPYIKQFRDRNPEIRLRVRSCSTQEGVKLLLADEVEFALGAKDSPLDETLDYHELLTYGFVLIASPDHPLAGCEAISPGEAAAWPAIMPAGTYSREFRETAARYFGDGFKAAIEVGGWEVIKRYVAAGRGIAIVPSISVSETDQVSLIPLEESLPARSYGVFTLSGKLLTSPARRFLQLMDPDFSSLRPT